MTGLPGRRDSRAPEASARGAREIIEPGRSARLALRIRRACPLWRLHFPGESDARYEERMNAREMSRRRSQRRIGAAPYFCEPARLYDLHTPAISTRQYFQVEIAVSHSKQRIGAPATRQFSWGSPAQTSVKPCQLFSLVSHSKQTIETQIKCQFFAMSPNHLFRVSNFAWSTTSEDAGLKYPALRLVLRRANGRVLPTGLALDYDSARSAAEGGSFGRVKKNDRRSPGPAKVHPMMCGSLFQHACPSAMAPSTIAVRTEFLARIRKQIPRRPDRGLAPFVPQGRRDDNEIRMI